MAGGEDHIHRSRSSSSSMTDWSQEGLHAAATAAAAAAGPMRHQCCRIINRAKVLTSHNQQVDASFPMLDRTVQMSTWPDFCVCVCVCGWKLYTVRTN